MKTWDIILSFTIQGVGLWVIVGSYRLGLQTFTDPGPGLFPFLLGAVLCLFSGPICINSVKELRDFNIATEWKAAEDRGGLIKLGVAVACLSGFLLLLNVLGFLITCFIFLFGLFWLGNPRRWLFVFMFSAIMAILSYIIFNIILQIPFPQGLFR